MDLVGVVNRIRIRLFIGRLDPDCRIFFPFPLFQFFHHAFSLL